MALFPPSTNRDYLGSPVAAWFLMLAALLELIPGCIHYFLPDGGAGVIAGLDLSKNGAALVAVFAWFGALQIPVALLLFVIGLRYRTMAPLGLLVVILSCALMSIDGWFFKGAAGDHHPPEHYASPIAVGLGLIFLVLALRERPASKS